MTNPIIAEITRGSIIESVHRGAFVVTDNSGTVILTAGDIDKPIYTRSAAKAFQCLPVIESGAADHFNFSAEEIALCCSSHDGEPDHVRVALQILQKIGVDEICYECGAHWPLSRKAAYQLVRDGAECRQIHNCCSGKHAGMLALAKYLGVDSKDYVTLAHPVQQTIAKAMSAICDFDLTTAQVAIDGCSVPTWAVPLRNTAMGYARLSDSDAGRRIISAVRSHPFMIAGAAGFDSRVMSAIPRLFMKFGAEGVYCGTIAHAGLGFAMKCDDGAKRSVGVAVAHMLSKLDVWEKDEVEKLNSFAHESIRNWRKLETGELRSNF